MALMRTGNATTYSRIYILADIAFSWEPESNVAGCQRLLASFWDHVGTDNKDYSINHTIKAKEKWIS